MEDGLNCCCIKKMKRNRLLWRWELKIFNNKICVLVNKVSVMCEFLCWKIGGDKNRINCEWLIDLI